MRNLIVIFIVLFFVISLNTFSHTVVADDDFEEKDNYYEKEHDGEEQEDERFEEIGKMIGWGTVITMGTSGLIFPFRRLTKSFITTFPTSKGNYISITKFLSKYHIWIGIAALLLSIGHGIVMYFSEGELEGEGIIGIGGVVLMIIAGIFGTVLFKNKKVKSLRTTHTILITLATMIVLSHILFS
ncbi:hypothetical protein [Lysinibacillus sp. BW-2-10]|uniref:hypothetical protein n=1 Tax=Lysinibacillus sp. BW-2-10 TaxID=2590030 RepID=UPI002105BAED|nr:hypothetical protein [Lysinibacillus sp. BW-2-10]